MTEKQPVTENKIKDLPETDVEIKSNVAVSLKGNVFLEQVVDPCRKGWFDNVIIRGFSVHASSVVHAIPKYIYAALSGQACVYAYT